MLTSDKEVEWPEVSIETTMKNLDENPQIAVKLRLKNDSVFTMGDEVRYHFSTHIGWSRGERRRWAVDPAQQSQTFSDSYVVPGDSPLVGLYAGMEISYGRFVKTIHDQHLIYRGTWADPIRLK